MDKVVYSLPGTVESRSSLVMVPGKLLRLIRLSRLETPGLIHSYGLFPHGLLALAAGIVTGRKTGVSLISGPIEAYSIGWSRAGTYSYCRPLPDPGLRSRIILRILKRFDIITVTGTFTKDFLLRRGFDEKKIFVLPHMVDDRFSPADLDKEIDIVYVGRLAPEKHVETLIGAVDLMKNTVPSIKVAIVGDGPSRRKLEDLTERFGLTGQITFTGHQTNVWDWYRRSRLSVLTSEREGFPFSVIESLRCGVPPVVSSCGDIVDLVKEGFNGRIITDCTDSQAYASALIDLLTHPDLIQNFSKNCIDSTEHLTAEMIARIWIELLGTVRAKHNSNNV